MSSTRIPSPAHSQGVISTPRRHRFRASRSVGSPARSNTSAKLSTLVQEHKMDSFILSPLHTRRSVLSDKTDIEVPGRKSWWKGLEGSSRDVMEFMESEEQGQAENVEELIDADILSQEKKNYTIDLPESSDGESISSIVIPQRKLFTHKDQALKVFKHIDMENRENLPQLHRSKINYDNTVNVGKKDLFNRGNRERTKPAFPTALLNISANKTVSNKRDKDISKQGQVRNLFGNRPAAKRKNMFAEFIVSESEDEISDIQPKVFGFAKNSEQQRLRVSSSQRVRETSPTSDVTDIEMDDWKLLPSSTMVENHFGHIESHTPVKKARLSKLNETVETAKESNDITRNKTNQTSKSIARKSVSKTSKFRNGEEFFESPLSEDDVIDKEKSDTEQNTIGNKQNEQKEKSSSPGILEVEPSKLIDTRRYESDDEKNDSNNVNDKNNVTLKENSVNGVDVADSGNRDSEKQENENISMNLRIEQGDSKKFDAYEHISGDNEISQKIAENGEENVQNEEKHDGEEDIEEEYESGENYDNQDEDEQDNEDENIQEESGEQLKNVSNDEERIIEDSNPVSDEENEFGVDNQDQQNDGCDEKNNHNPVVSDNNQDKSKRDNKTVSREISVNLRSEDATVHDRTIRDNAQDKHSSKHDTSVKSRGRIELVMKSPEEVLNYVANDMQSFSAGGREMSSRKTRSVIRMNEPRPSLAPLRESTGIPDGTRDSSAERSGWDSHRTTRKTLRQTFGKDFTPRKSLRALVMEKSAKRHTHAFNATAKTPQASSTRLPESMHVESAKVDDVIDPRSELREETANRKTNDKVTEANEVNRFSHSSSHDASKQRYSMDSDAREKLPQDDVDEGGETIDDRRDSHGLGEVDESDDGRTYSNDVQDQESASEREDSRDIEGEKSGDEGGDSQNMNEGVLSDEDGADSSDIEGAESDEDRRDSHDIQESDQSGEEENLDSHISAINASEKRYSNISAQGQPSNMTKESNHDDSRKRRRSALELCLQTLKQKNLENRRQAVAKIETSLKATPRESLDPFKVPRTPNALRRVKSGPAKPKVRTIKRTLLGVENLPPEFLEDLNYKPPRRYRPANASWITKRLYNYLEAKLEPKYDYKARVRAEKLAEGLYEFAKEARRRKVADANSVEALKREMARLGIVATHLDFYQFFHEFMPREIRVKVVPDVANKISMPKHGVFSNIIV
ncbi:unnamed protein product, partial [Iphiclides podalirius]